MRSTVLLRAERLAAADAMERLLLLHDPARRAPGREVELRRQRDHLLRAGRRAEAALHAGALVEIERRLVLAVGERAGRAGRHAGQAQGAAVDVDLDGAERRAGRQRHPVDRRRGGAVQLEHRGLEQVALPADRQERRRAGRRGADRDAVERGPQRVGIVGLDQPAGLRAEAERARQQVRDGDVAGQPRRVVPAAGRGRARAPPRRPRRRARSRPRRRAAVTSLTATGSTLAGKPGAEAGERVDQRLAVVLIVEQHHRVRAAGPEIGAEQRPKPPQQGLGARDRVGGGAGRAGGGAAAAAGADPGDRSRHGRRPA